MRYGKWEVVVEGRVDGIEDAHITHEKRRVNGMVWIRTVLTVGKRKVVLAKSSREWGTIVMPENCPTFRAYLQVRFGSLHMSYTDKAIK